MGDEKQNEKAELPRKCISKSSKPTLLIERERGASFHREWHNAP
jgi:hypothetical protein